MTVVLGRGTLSQHSTRTHSVVAAMVALRRSMRMARALTSVHFHSRMVSVHHVFTCTIKLLAEVMLCAFAASPIVS
jgi:hypothetical protein